MEYKDLEIFFNSIHIYSTIMVQSKRSVIIMVNDQKEFSEGDERDG